MSLEIINNVTVIWMLLAAVVLIVLQFVKAPYGRYASSSRGMSIDNKLGWVLMELPSFFIMLGFIILGNPSSYTLFIAVLWLAHYFHRSIIFPARMSTKGKKMPVAVLLAGIAFNIVNAGLNGYFLGFLADCMTVTFFGWNFAVGVVIFLVGAWLNISNDNVLFRLRDGGELSYKIPHGIAYKYVSCPNLLGEIIEWGGFAIVAWNLPALSFLIWTIANLIPRAMVHHQWYKENFDDYPEERKAIIPFLL